MYVFLTSDQFNPVVDNRTAHWTFTLNTKDFDPNKRWNVALTKCSLSNCVIKTTGCEIIVLMGDVRLHVPIDDSDLVRQNDLVAVVNSALASDAVLQFLGAAESLVVISFVGNMNRIDIKCQPNRIEGGARHYHVLFNERLSTKMGFFEPLDIHVGNNALKRRGKTSPLLWHGNEYVVVQSNLITPVMYGDDRMPVLDVFTMRATEPLPSGANTESAVRTDVALRTKSDYYSPHGPIQHSLSRTSLQYCEMKLCNEHNEIIRFCQSPGTMYFVLRFTCE